MVVRCQFDNMTYFRIEINKSYQHYLGTYSFYHSIDHLIKKVLMKYRCWRYWISPMIYAMYIAVVIAYDMYLEMEE